MATQQSKYQSVKNLSYEQISYLLETLKEAEKKGDRYYFSVLNAYETIVDDFSRDGRKRFTTLRRENGIWKIGQDNRRILIEELQKELEHKEPSTTDKMFDKITHNDVYKSAKKAKSIWKLEE